MCLSYQLAMLRSQISEILSDDERQQAPRHCVVQDCGDLLEILTVVGKTSHLVEAINGFQQSELELYERDPPNHCHQLACGLLMAQAASVVMAHRRWILIVPLPT